MCATRIPQARFAAALRTELAWEAARLGRRELGSIFFGGGTPSLMESATVAALIDDAAKLFEPADDIEITLEANPTSVEAGRLAAFRAAGVNRVSLGVQSLDPVALRMLGRQHWVAQAIAALEMARRLFPRVSFDLIYARPGQAAGGLADRAAAGAVAGGGSSVALPAHHRARYRVRGAVSAGRDRAAGSPRQRRSSTWRPGRRRRAAVCSTMRFPTMRSRAPRAGITWPIGATAITRASDPARMVVSRSMARSWQPGDTARRNHGRSGSSGTATGRRMKSPSLRPTARARCC